MRSEFKVAVCELTSVDDAALNLEQIEAALAAIHDPSSYQLVCFPENALYMRLSDRSLSPLRLDDELFRPLKEWSCKHQCVIHLGSVPLEIEGAPYNASVLISRDGTVSSPYQKIHLFDVDVKGERRVAESDSFRHGADSSVFEIDGWKIGSSICYDLRFAELYARYAKLEVDIILVPSAFLVRTGEAHWDILLRARAIENQCYVLAAAQGGEHVSSHGVRHTYGHSMIVDPWGVKLSETRGPASSDRVLTATLSRDRINEVRRQIPMTSHRRL